MGVVGTTHALLARHAPRFDRLVARGGIRGKLRAALAACPPPRQQRSGPLHPPLMEWLCLGMALWRHRAISIVSAHLMEKGAGLRASARAVSGGRQGWELIRNETVSARDRHPRVVVPVASPPVALPPGHHLLLEDTELVNDPRGGWRFRDLADEAHFGVAGDLGQRATPAAKAPAQEDPQALRQRLEFGGDAQFPPHSYPHSGTQGTWDDALLGPGVPSSSAGHT